MTVPGSDDAFSGAPAASGGGVPAESNGHADFGYLHRLLAVQSVVIVLLSINRLSSLTQGFVADNEFLRWVDFHNMLTLPLASLIAFYLLKKHIEHAGRARPDSARWLLGLNLAFIVGVYLLGAGYGDHEMTNYLHGRFCESDPTSDLCRIVIFNDDEFSHWVFFAGYVLINGALMLLQAALPYPREAVGRDRALFILNGVFIGLGVFANLAFEVIGLDLYIIALLALLSVHLLRRRGPEPLLVYYSTAYVLGLVLTFVVKAFRGDL